MRRALSRSKTRPAGIPPARGHRLDHLWQRPPHRLAQRLPANRQGGKNTWRRVVRPGSADVPVGIRKCRRGRRRSRGPSRRHRFQKRGRGDVYLRKSTVSRIDVAIRRTEVRPETDLRRPHQKLEVARLRSGLVHESRRLRHADPICRCVRLDQLNLPRPTSSHSLAARFRNRPRHPLRPHELQVGEPRQP